MSKKTVVNKEPYNVNPQEIERMYLVHRERVLSTGPIVDCRLRTYSFMENQSWKKLRSKYEDGQLQKHNEIIYSRINRVEEEESVIAKERRLHLQKINVGRKHMKRFREGNRQHQYDKIERENKLLHDRLSKTKPYYPTDVFQKSFEKQQHLKKHWAVDHTVGHILHCPQIPPLPPLNPTMGSLQRSLIKSTPTSSQLSKSKTYDSLLYSESKSRNSLDRQSLSGGLAALGSLTDSQDFLDELPIIENSQDLFFMNQYPSSELEKDKKIFKNTYSNNNTSYNSQSNKPNTIPPTLNMSRLEREKYDKDNNNNPSNDEELSVLSSKSSHSHTSGQQVAGTRNGGDLSSPPISNRNPPSVSTTFTSATTINNNITHNLKSVSSTDKVTHHNQHLKLLLSRTISLPNSSKNCYIKAYVSKQYDENIYLHAISTTSGEDTTGGRSLLAERVMTIDEAYELIGSDAAKSSTGEDVQSLRSLLVNMFKEADTENNGFLNYMEFQRLMEKIDLGITPQELRFVISEADENDNGYIDYHEFVPLAVDMIQAFKARTRAKHIQAEQDHTVEDEVLSTLSSDELEYSVNRIMEKIKEFDGRVAGSLRIADFKKCLKDSMVGLSHIETNMIIQNLPRDGVGRVLYDNLRRVLYDVRFTVMKNTVVEAQGSDIQKYLMELCKEEEKNKMIANGEDGTTSGWISLRSMINLMVSSPRLSLSRLQVMVIASEATVEDGYVNYWQFIPIAAKTIEMMFDPKSLRRRAELIENMKENNISPTSLLYGMAPDAIQRRLNSLFKSYDFDNSGELDVDEFRACLDSLDLNLTPGEIIALMSTADSDRNGNVNFAEFQIFCMTHLLHLEREKHIRQIQEEVLNSNVLTEKANESNVADFEERLRKIFTTADVDRSGFLSLEEMYGVFASMDIGMSQYQLSVLASEADVNEDGLIDYKEFVPICADLLQAFKGNNFAMIQMASQEKWAEQKAAEISGSFYSEMVESVKYLRDRIRLIDDSITDLAMKRHAIAQVLRSPHSGLNRTEANLLLARLLPLNNTPTINATTATPSLALSRRPSIINRRGSFSAGSRPDSGGNAAVSAPLLSSRLAASINNTTGNTSSKPNNASAKSAVASIVRDNASTSKSGSLPNSRPGSSRRGAAGGKQPLTRNNSMLNHSTSGGSEEYTISLSKLEEYVHQVRKMTVMRGLLESLNPTDIATNLITAFEKELRASSDENAGGGGGGGQEDYEELSVYVPTSLCYKILKENNSLRLNKVQLLAIMSWADCFEEGGLGIDYKLFSRYAADVIVKMGDAVELEHRAEVVNRVNKMEKEKVIGGLTNEDLEAYLVRCLSESEDTQGNVNEIVFLEALANIPSVKLTYKEAASAAAGVARNNDGTIYWREFLPWAYNTIHAICTERMIGRRMTLLAANSDTGDMTPLEELAERIMNYIYLRMINGRLCITFPTDEIRGDKDRRRPNAIQMLKPINHKDSRISLPADSINNNSSNSPSNIIVRKISAPHTPTTVIHPNSSSNNNNSNNSNTAASCDLMRLGRIIPIVDATGTKKGFMAMLLRIAENDVVLNPEKSPMHIIATSIDMSFSTSIPLPIRMPSIGMVDREAAEQFALNLVSKLYIHVGHKGVRKLHVSVGELGGNDY